MGNEKAFGILQLRASCGAWRVRNIKKSDEDAAQKQNHAGGGGEQREVGKKRPTWVLRNGGFQFGGQRERRTRGREGDAESRTRHGRGQNGHAVDSRIRVHFNWGVLHLMTQIAARALKTMLEPSPPPPPLISA